METTSKQYKSKWRRHRCRKKSSKTIIMELTSIKSTSSNPNQLMRKPLGPEGITKGMTKARILDHHPASITYCTILRLLTVTLLTRLIILRILQMMQTRLLKSLKWWISTLLLARWTTQLKKMLRLFSKIQSCLLTIISNYRASCSLYWLSLAS